MVESMGKKPVVAATNWMLDLALSQEIRWKEMYALSEKDVGIEPAKA